MLGGRIMVKSNKPTLTDDNMKPTSSSEKKNDSINLTSTEKDRFVYLNGIIDEEKSKDIIEKLLELQSKDPLEEITIIINSMGGEIYSMFAIIDIMDILLPSIRTISLGLSASASAFIFICGTIGRRFMTKHSSLMLHQASGGTHGTVKDIDVTVREIKYLQSQVVEGIANRSKLTIEEIKGLIDRDFYIRPEKAIEFGLCDGIIERLS